MDTREQLSRARKLIEARRYEEARALLRRIDHPKAKEWLARLPPPRQAAAKKKSSGGGMRAYLLALVLIVIVGAGGLLALNQSKSDDEEASGTQPAQGVSFDDMQPNSAQISITGAYRAAGEPEVTFVTEPSGQLAPRQIVMRVDVESSDATEPTGTFQLFITVPDDPPGTYPVVDVLHEMSQSWGVVHSIVGRESWISPDDMDAIAIEGSITVVENGDSFTGSFEFTTSSTADDRSITVSGRVNQIRFAADG